MAECISQKIGRSLLSLNTITLTNMDNPLFSITLTRGNTYYHCHAGEAMKATRNSNPAKREFAS